MFEFDIFLSYARCNNTAGWVTEFRNALKNALKEKMDDVRIFMDVKDIEGGQAYDDRIKNSLRKSAVLVIVISDALLHPTREWCHREREEFIRYANGNTEGRIYLVNYDGVDPRELPAEIGRLIPYEFFERDESTEDILPGLIKKAGRYHRALYSLRRDLKQALKRLRARPVSPPVDQTPNQSAESEGRVVVKQVSDGPTVFLPEALNIRTSQEHYQQVEAAIAQRARVVPGRKSFYAAYDGFQQELDGHLQQADLFVQLLNPQRWPESSAFEGGYERWLLERAADQRVPALRWLDPHLPLEYVQNTAPQHAEFLQLAGGGYGRLEPCMLSDFIELIFQELDRQIHRQKYDISGDGHPVLVVANDADEALGDEVGEELDHLGEVEPELLLCPDTALIDVGQEAAALTPRGLVIAWDHGPEPLLINMMKQCRRYRKSRELNPPTCAVVVPSLTTHSIKKRPTGFKILGKDDQSGLQQFVDEICGEGS